MNSHEECLILVCAASNHSHQAAALSKTYSISLTAQMTKLLQIVSIQHAHALLIICLILPFLPGGAMAADDNNSLLQARIKIGYVTDLTGLGAFFGLQSIRGAELARKDFSTPQSPVEIVIEDSSGQGKSAVAAAIKLLQLDKVDAVLCDLTPLCAPIAPVVKAAGKPLIFQSPARSIAADSEYAYMNFIDYVQACSQIAGHWKSKGVKPLGSLIPNLEFGELCAQGFAEVAKDHYSYRYNPHDDLKNAVSAFRSRGIKGVVHVGYESDFLAWFKYCREQRYFPSHGFVEVMLSELLRKEAGEVLNSAAIVGYEEISPAFLSRLRTEAPGPQEVNLQGAALAYNAIEALVRALAECPKRELECIDRALRAKREPSLLGFSGWHNEKGNYYPVRMKVWQGEPNSGGLKGAG